MGRKTWDSIPTKFRPLAGRRNIVISRSLDPSPFSTDNPENVNSDGPFIVKNLQDAIDFLTTARKDNGNNGGGEGQGGRVFVIGGAQIYQAALERREAKRVLLTRVLGDFECDTFFPVGLEGGESGGWVKKRSEELRAWTGEESGVGEVVEEAGTRYCFEMWER
jgi:dihydrofolate reductase